MSIEQAALSAAIDYGRELQQVIDDQNRIASELRDENSVLRKQLERVRLATRPNECEGPQNETAYCPTSYLDPAHKESLKPYGPDCDPPPVRCEETTRTVWHEPKAERYQG